VPKSPKTSRPAVPGSLPASLAKTVPAAVYIMAAMSAVAKEIPKLQRQVSANQKAGAITLARTYVVVHRMQARIDEILKPLSELSAQLKNVAIPEAFEAEGIPSVNLEEGFRVGVSVTTRASVRPGQKEAAIEWLSSNGYADIVQPTINASTLSSLAKQIGEDNKDLPDTIFNVALMTNTSVTATK